MARLGVHLHREDFAGENGTFDPCWYMQFAADEIAILAASLGSTGLDAVAQALTFVMLLRPLPGTGPYRLVSEAADRVHLEAFAAYHGGVPRRGTSTSCRRRPAAPAWSPERSTSFRTPIWGPPSGATAAERDVRVAALPSLGYYSLLFNVRPGRLFADRALRRALQLCVDLPRDIDAATGGGGIAIYAPVLPGSWGDDPTSRGLRGTWQPPAG